MNIINQERILSSLVRTLVSGKSLQSATVENTLVLKSSCLFVLGFSDTECITCCIGHKNIHAIN